MLRAALNRSWRDHPTNKELYGNTPPLSQSIRRHRLRFAGHCWRSKQELAGDLVVWAPSHGRRSQGRPRMTYPEQLANDIGCLPQELPALMSNKDEWRRTVSSISRASSTQ